MAPPLVIAARRAPRRPRSRPFTRSRCRYAPYRPRRAAMPSDSIATTSSNSSRGRGRGTDRLAGPCANSSVRCQSSAAHIATICCARMSSGASGTRMPIELAAAHGQHERRALDQLVARRGEQAALRHGTAPMAGAADALHATAIDRGDPMWHTRSTVPDVDAELERGRGDERPQLAGFEPPLGVEANLAREAAVVRRHRIGPEPLGEMVRHALGEPPRVDEDERRSVLAARARRSGRRSRPRVSCDATGPSSLAGHFDGQVELASRRDLDDDRRRPADCRQELRDGLDRLLRRRQADARAAVARSAPRAVRARARGASRACRRRPRGSRPRSPSSTPRRIARLLSAVSRM